MSDDADVSLTRGEVTMVTPESKTGFPMRHNDWDKLKNKIQSLQKEHSFWHAFGWKDMGMVFWGIALTSVVSLWLPGYSNSHQQNVAMIIAVISFILGGVFIFFQYQLEKKNNDNVETTVSHIIDLMDFIDADYSKQNTKE